MTTFAGQILDQFGDFFYPPESLWPTSRPAPAESYALYDPGDLIIGPLTTTEPLSLRTQSRGGELLRTFLDDFYSQIYFTPLSIDFGAVAGDTSVSILVWNAYFVVQTLDTVTPPADQGVEVAGETLPATFQPLAQKLFTITALAEGSPSITGTVDFAFEGLPSFSLRISGVRSILHGFMPDWGAASFKVTREFKTDLWTSRSGKEQRRPLRKRARKSLEFTATLKTEDLRTFIRLMEKRNGVTVTMPDYSRWARTAAAALVTDSSVTIDGAAAWAVEGANVQFQNGAQTATQRILSVADDVITFSAPLGQAWAQGTLVRPILSGRFTADVKGSFPTNTVGKIDITFDVTPASEPDIDPPDAPLTFNGREVFLRSPNWATNPQPTFSDPFETIDYGYGRIAYFDPVKFNTLTRQAVYVAKTNADAELLENLFERMKGRQGTFYMPTGLNDLPLKDETAGSSLSFRVAGRDTYDAYVSSTVYRAVAILMNDGSYVFGVVQELTQVSDTEGDDTLVGLAAPIGRDLSADTVALISWMPAWRFATDTLVSEWLTDGVAQMQMNHQTVEDITSA